MELEEKIVKTIVERFPSLEEHIKVQRRQRIIIDSLGTKEF